MIPAKVRAVVDERDEHACVHCGARANNRHHRTGGMGGSSLPDHDSPQGIVTLCGMGNVNGCHGRAHKDRFWAKANGYRVPHGTDPLTVPITHHAWGMAYLLEDGSVSLDPMDVIPHD